MKRFALILVLMVAGCSDPIVDEPVEDSPTQAEPAPVPRAVYQPQIDETFSNPETLAKWHADIDAEITVSASEADPRELFEAIAATYSISMSNIEALFGEQETWNSGYVRDYGEELDQLPEPKSLETAAYLERQDQKWPAAQIFFAHGDFVGANRCAKKLFDEGSYKVAAMTAVMTGDLEMMTAATTKMVEKREITRTFDVIRFALQENKVQAARHIADTHDFDLTEVTNTHVARSAAIAGDPSLLPPFIEETLSQWESGRMYSNFDPSSITADIAILGKTDPEQARGFAARYLKFPDANVVLWVRCGESCYATPMVGTVELYELVKEDPELRDAYLDRTREFVNDVFPVIPRDGDEHAWGEGTIHGVWAEYADWSSDQYDGHLLFTLLMSVRASGDSNLIALWTELLSSFGTRLGDYNGGNLAFEREMGRGILGLSVNPAAPDLELDQQYLLARLTGAPAPDLSPLWDQMSESRRYDRYETSSQDLSLLIQMLLKGSVDQSAQEALLRKYELVVEEGNNTPASLLSWKFQISMGAHYGTSHRFSALINAPWKALRTNKRAVSERASQGLAPIDLYPITEDQVDEMMAQHLARMQSDLPVPHARYQARHPPRP